MQSNKLYVGNLPYGTTDDEVRDLFSSYGTINEIKIIEGKGFGFVEMETQEEAENAKEKLDGYEFNGRTLKVAEARPQRSRGGRGGGPGRGGRRGGFNSGRRFQ
ncbi:MAG: RNA-binding protein [Candidatus Aminicenantes bacterium]|nr:RNA-binding protein [Candidatus Aminicenantes bacterium]NIM78665.1 RNA-binding protein [Candidatus Aminicenantes bacterium]NIN17912.1 RNA-binding protein [Candidatus Aminicenantes bacterium]NIN41815.1 RNA-binding protein [Candidatus Aminicenantes bacterium]NIN84567.1 RNA-binding protein [Candidatus Aminicenantes bacterium]